MRPHYEGPTFVEFYAHPSHETGRMLCPCGMRFPLGFTACDRYGENTPEERYPAIVRCISSGHIITVDGVVIGQREVTTV